MATTLPIGALDRGVLAPLAPRRSAAELAYAHIRQAVISLALPPGAVIARGAIADRLGISQTPVREALIRLQQEGLIEVVPQSATRVARIDLASAEEAHFLRLSVELQVVRRLAEAPSPGLARVLAAELDAMAALLDAADEAGFVEADASFHRALHVAAGVPGLRDLVRSRSGHLDRLRRLHIPRPGKAEAVLGQHRALAAAILAGDPDAAEGALRAHLSGTFGEVDLLRQATPEFF